MMGIRKDFARSVSGMNEYQLSRARAAYQRAVDFGDPDPVGFATQLFRESAFDPTAKSHAGAAGEAQFMPATAERFGLNPLDPDSSQVAALKYRKYIRDFNAKKGIKGEHYVLAGYNAGEGNAVRAATKFKETRGYIKFIDENRDGMAAMLGKPAPAMSPTLPPPTEGGYGASVPAPNLAVSSVQQQAPSPRSMLPSEAYKSWRDSMRASMVQKLFGA